MAERVGFWFVAEYAALAGAPIATARPAARYPLGAFVYDVDGPALYQRWRAADGAPLWVDVGGGGGTTVFGGDLVEDAPGVQRVVGLQSYPLDATPPALYDVLMGDGARWTPFHLTLDPEIIGPAFAVVLSTTPTLVEVGQTVVSPDFTASYSGGAYVPTEAILTNDDNPEAKDVTATPTAFNSDESYFRDAYGAVVTWTLTAAKGPLVRSDTATKTWTQLVYAGSGPPGESGESFLTSLPGTLRLTKNGAYALNAAPGEKVYLAYRAAYGASTFTIGGFQGGMLPPTTVSVTNSYGFTEDYLLYESTLAGLGAVTVVVS